MTRSVTLACLLALAGCEKEEIRRYKVERPEKPAVRLLAAVVPGGEKIWFVKVTGKPAAIEARKAEFEAFVASMKFPGQPPVSYTVPADWSEQPGKQAMRHATFLVGPDKLELIVTPLGLESAALKPNVDRWRGQIGLGPIPEAELPTITRTAKVGDKDVTFVDMVGQGDAPAPMASLPPAGKKATPPPVAAKALPKPIAYEVPAGWKELSDSGFRVAAFEAGKTADGKPLEVTVIPFGGPAGGLLANVNRWRTEVGLSETNDAELPKVTTSTDVGGERGVAVDFAGPESAGAKRERTLGVIVPRGGQTWFVKLRGPYDLVTGQKAAFETFTRSLRFAEQAGGKP